MKTPNDPISGPRIPLLWTERGQLYATLGELMAVRDKLVASRRNLKSREQFKCLCMSIGALETFMQATSSAPVGKTYDNKLKPVALAATA